MKFINNALKVIIFAVLLSIVPHNVIAEGTDTPQYTSAISISALTDSGTALDGVVFNISKGKDVLKFSTINQKVVPTKTGSTDIKVGSSGVLTVEGLEPGEYKVSYKHGAKNYSPERMDVMVSAVLTTPQPARFVFSLNSGSIKVNLNNLDTNLETESATIQIIDSNGSPIPFKSYSGVYKPAAGGTRNITVKNKRSILFEDIIVGNYTVVQTSLTPIKDVELIRKNIKVEKSKTSEVSITNEYKFGEFKIKNQEVETKNILEGSIFRVIDSSGNALRFKKLDNGDYIVADVGDTDIVIDKTGIAFLKNLPVGTYSVIQNKAPDKYSAIDSKIVVVEGSRPQEVLFENEILISKLKYKSLTDEGNPLVNHKFHLIDKDNKVVSVEGITGAYIFNEKGKVKDLITNEDGEITIEDIPSGEYRLKEISSVRGYVPSKEDISINLKTKEGVSIEKTYNRSSGLIITIDQDGDVIEEAAVDIYDKNTDELKYNGFTDENGLVDFRTLQDGAYYYKIDSLPSPYAHAGDKLEFEVINGVFEGLASPKITKTTVAIVNENHDLTVLKMVNERKEVFEQTRVESDGTVIFSAIPYGVYRVYRVEKDVDDIDYSKNFMSVEVDQYSYAGKGSAMFLPLEEPEEIVVPNEGIFANKYVAIGIAGLISALLVGAFILYRKKKKVSAPKIKKVKKPLLKKENKNKKSVEDLLNEYEKSEEYSASVENDPLNDLLLGDFDKGENDCEEELNSIDDNGLETILDNYVDEKELSSIYDNVSETISDNYVEDNEKDNMGSYYEKEVNDVDNTDRTLIVEERSFIDERNVDKDELIESTVISYID